MLLELNRCLDVSLPAIESLANLFNFTVNDRVVDLSVLRLAKPQQKITETNAQSEAEVCYARFVCWFAVRTHTTHTHTHIHTHTRHTHTTCTHMRIHNRARTLHTHQTHRHTHTHAGVRAHARA